MFYLRGLERAAVADPAGFEHAVTFYTRKWASIVEQYGPKSPDSPINVPAQMRTDLLRIAQKVNEQEDASA